ARIAPQHHRTPPHAGTVVERAVERPNLSRRAAGHLAEILDADVFEMALRADERGQPLHHLDGFDFLHFAHSLRIKMCIMKNLKLRQARWPTFCAIPSPSRLKPRIERPIARPGAVVR